MLNHNSVILLKPEVTYNTDPSPATSANELLVENLQWSFVNSRMAERPAARPSKGMLPPIYAGTLIQITFDAEVKGSGAAGTAPEIGAALQACGFSETISAGTSVTYEPASSSLKSCTIYFYRDGKVFKCTGCVGDVNGSVVAGQYIKFSFTFTGHLVSETDASVPTPSFDSTEPIALINLSSFAVDSTTFALTKFDFAMGNKIATPDDIVASDGFGQVQITGRDVSGSIDPEDRVVATYNWVSKWQASTDVALDTGVIGGTAGNKVQITMPAMRYTAQAPGDRDGIVTREVNFKACESSGDDEISIVFT